MLTLSSYVLEVQSWVHEPLTLGALFLLPPTHAHACALPRLLFRGIRPAPASSPIEGITLWGIAGLQNLALLAGKSGTVIPFWSSCPVEGVSTQVQVLRTWNQDAALHVCLIAANLPV